MNNFFDTRPVKRDIIKVTVYSWQEFRLIQKLGGKRELRLKQEKEKVK